jgi:hypothetical protein
VTHGDAGAQLAELGLDAAGIAAAARALVGAERIHEARPAAHRRKAG